MKAALLIFSLSVLAFSQQPAPEALSRIEGMVVKTSSGEPLAGAFLLLRPNGVGRSETQYGTTTAADGHFVLKNIPNGRYILSATMPGFVNQEYGQKQPNKPGAVLDLTNAQTLRDVTIRMTAGGAISGHVYDQTGQPVEGTVIRAAIRRYQRDGKPLLSEVESAVTNDIGEYRMYWLAPGTYYLLAVVLPKRTSSMPVFEPTIIDQSEQPPDTFAPLFYPGGDDDSDVTPIRLEAGSDLHAIDFSLTRSKALRVKGRVVDSATGRPIADAGLELKLKYVNGGLRSFGLAAHTDSEGKFEFHNASPGKFILSTRWTEPGFRSMSAQQELQIGNKDVSDLQIALQANGGISGRVIMERGEPLPQNRTVLLFNEGDTSFGTGIQPDGTFSLSNISTGTLHLELTGFPDNFFIRAARAGGKDVLREGLNLADNSADPLEVIVASEGGTVEGVVNDDRQSPVVGAHVILMPNAERRERPDLIKTATTDQHGRFAIRGAVPGDYKIFGWEDLEPNIYFDPSFMEQYESQGKPIHIDADGHTTETLRSIP